jgi:hypothetical protein
VERRGLILGIFHYPLINALNQHIDSLHLDETTIPTLGQVVSINRPNSRPNWAGGGAHHGLVQINPSSLGYLLWSSRLGLWWFHAGLSWFDFYFGLVLHLFWALLCFIGGLLPLWLMLGISCNRTDQIIRAQVQKQAHETLKFFNLSPYNLGSQSKPQRISNQLAYNQDRIIQHNTSHVTFHKYLIKSYNTMES